MAQARRARETREKSSNRAALTLGQYFLKTNVFWDVFVKIFFA
jgi:hypothetical protein